MNYLYINQTFARTFLISNLSMFQYHQERVGIPGGVSTFPNMVSLIFCIHQMLFLSCLIDLIVRARVGDLFS